MPVSFGISSLYHLTPFFLVQASPFSNPVSNFLNCLLSFRDRSKRAVSETQYSPYFRPFFLFFFSVVLHISENIFTKFSNNY